MGVVVDHHDGGKTAGAEAGHGFQREVQILGGFAGLDVEVMTHRLEHGSSAADVAGRSLADADDVLAAGVEMELCVECDYAEDLRHGNVEFGCDAFEHFLRQIAVNILSLLQNGDERSLGVLLVRLQDVHQRSKVNGFGRAVARHGGILLVQYGNWRVGMTLSGGMNPASPRMGTSWGFGVAALPAAASSFRRKSFFPSERCRVCVPAAVSGTACSVRTGWACGRSTRAPGKEGVFPGALASSSAGYFFPAAFEAEAAAGVSAMPTASSMELSSSHAFLRNAFASSLFMRTGATE